MTYVVTDACIRCKYMDCVEVCPVDCFYEGENMLVINPSECIDCGVCEPECPAEAILPDTESGLEAVAGAEQHLLRPVAQRHRKLDQTPPDADAMKGVENNTTSSSARNPARATDPDHSSPLRGGGRAKP